MIRDIISVIIFLIGSLIAIYGVICKNWILWVVGSVLVMILLFFEYIKEKDD